MGEVTHADFPFRTIPYQHQLDCWRVSKDREYFALFLAMGCGKTKVLLDTTAYLKSNNKIDAQVIIVPKGVQGVWADEQIPTHLSCEDNFTACWSASPRAEEREKLDELMRAPGKHMRSLVLNCEGLTSANAKSFEYLKAFLTKYRCMLAVDESTTIKSGTAARTKILIALGKRAAYRRIMTGNPIPNGPLDLYSQAEFLQKGLLGFSSVFGFRNRFAVMQDMNFGSKSFKKIVGYRDQEVLKQLMRQFSFIIKKEDCLDLPEKIYQTVDVEMSTEQKKAYDDMCRDAFILLGDGRTVSAEMVMTQLTRLHQIACGFMQTDSGVAEFPGINKRIEAMMGQIEQAEGKVIIWAAYRRNVEQIVSALQTTYGKESVETFYGGSDSRNRPLATAKFQDPTSPVRFMVANPQAGKFGNTWTQGTTVIYFSNSYNLEDRDQSEDRSHRIGQKSNVVYVDLRCPNTVDDRIIRVLKSKKKLTDQIVQSNWKWLMGLN